MLFDAFYIYCSLVRGYHAGSAYGAVILARAASDTTAFVDRRAHVAVVGFYHVYCSGGAVTRAVAAGLPVGGGYTLCDVDLCGSDFDCGFLGLVDRQNSPGRADVGTCCAFRTTEPFGKRHYRLHE